MSHYAEVLAALESDRAVAAGDVRRWIDSGDVLTWSAVYTLLSSHADRIEPQLSIDDRLEFARRYLLRCLEQNPTPGEHLHGGYEAAWELAAVLRQWRRDGGRAAGAIRGVALDLERLYRRADAALQTRILCGVMEHAFEDRALRRYFAQWERDRELREVYKLAAEWGAAHEE